MRVGQASYNPCELPGQFADLGVEVMGGLHGGLILGGLVGEQVGQVGEGLVSPVIELVGMQPVGGGQLVDELLLAEDLLHQLSLELRTKMSSGIHGLILP